MTNEILTKIKEKLALVPMKPGCYQMHNEQGTIIYVGKAKILKNRLTSYFHGAHDAKTTRMVEDIFDFEYIITSNETEAFLLELNFIKKYRPKYNIMMMDDKTYPYIVITNELHPRLIIERDLAKGHNLKKAKYFGPYPDGKTCKVMVDVLNKLYPFRKCNTIPKKACLYKQLGLCLAPCEEKIDTSIYTKMIDEVSHFLMGHTKQLQEVLEKAMLEASTSLNYEKALEYRDLSNRLKEVFKPQKMITSSSANQDIFGFYVQDDIVCIQVLNVRYGKIIERTGNVFDVMDNLEDVLLNYIYNFYASGSNDLPKEIIIPYIEGYEVLETLFDRPFIIPVRGTKKKLVDLVCENALNSLTNLQKTRLLNYQKTKKPLEDLGVLLSMEYPYRIEIFDNSNIQGTSAVSGMVTYIDGVKCPKEYRKYKVKTIQGSDDYHTMQEVITRRYQRIIKDKLVMPDLIIVDGGIPQVNASRIALENLHLNNVNLIGLEKDDFHKTKGIIKKDNTEILLDKHTELYLLLASMQEEVHRFAISFFKQTHTKTGLTSALDGVEGIGKTRKKLLWDNFSSIDEMKNAPDAKLVKMGFPKKVIQGLKEALNKQN